MKTVPIVINLPIDALVLAVTPEVREALISQKAAKRRAEILPPDVALVQALNKLTNALLRFENGQGTRDERSAVASLVASARGVRTAFASLKKPL